MKEIEDAFQALAEEMLSTGRDTFTHAENKTLTEFYRAMAGASEVSAIFQRRS